MITKLLVKSLAAGKARFACAALGVAAATGALVFMFGLVATNDAQAPFVVRRLAAPWQSWHAEGNLSPFGPGPKPGLESDGKDGKSGRNGMGHRPNSPMTPSSPMISHDGSLSLPLVAMTLDFRPEGRVMQGPPLRGTIAPFSAECPYTDAKFVSGTWPAVPSHQPQAVVCTSVFSPRQLTPPAIGDTLTFVGEKGTLVVTVAGVIDRSKTLMGFPDVFVDTGSFASLSNETMRGSIALNRTVVPGATTPEELAPRFISDASRNFGRSTPLLLTLALVTALCLLVNSLLLSLESNRRALAILRTVGLSAGGVVKLVLAEAFAAAVVGTVVGVVVAYAGLAAFAAADPETYPAGAVFPALPPVLAFLGACFVALVAALIALKPALAVRPLDAASFAPPPRRRRLGMTIAFGCGFGAFVAVEVWGASLTKPFIPSKTWPDAIVSVLPGGFDASLLEKLDKIPGVAKCLELAPLQIDFEPAEPLPAMKGRPPMGGNRNALFLGSDMAAFAGAHPLAPFDFVEGDRASAVKMMAETNACLVTAMMSRARKLHKGGVVTVKDRMGTVFTLPIAGVVDVNWHMFTSRSLVRGMRRMPGMTEGPVFVKFDTLMDMMPPMPFAPSVTHLWLNYDPAFLKAKGVFPAGREVEDSIRKALGGVPGSTVRLHNRDEVADGTLSHGAELVGAMARIPFVSLAVIAIGFVALLVASADASKREFAVLHAVGATRGQLARRLVDEALKTAAWGLVFGLVFGALSGWGFTWVTKQAMSSWGLPAELVVPWKPVVLGALGAVVFVLVVAIPTSLALIRKAAHSSTALSGE